MKYRIPYILGTSGAPAASANVLLAEAEFRNDTPYTFEAYGVGFSLAGAATSNANQDYSDVEVRLVDVARVQPLMQADSRHVPVSALLDIASSSPSMADLFAFNGARWQFRYPYLMPAGQKLAVSINNLLSSASESMDVVLLGALLVGAEGKPEHAEALGALARAIPYGDFQPYRQSGGDLMGYARVPYVMSGASGAITAATPQRYREDLFRNQSQYPFHIYEMAFNLAAIFAQYPTQNYRDVSINVTDPTRNQGWMKAAQRVSTLLKYHGNRMSVGQGPVFHGTKWDLGPGTLLPPGIHLQVDVTDNISPTSVNLTVAFVGDLLVPVQAGSVFAGAFEDHLSALPGRW